MALPSDHLGANTAGILLGLGIGFASFYFFSNKKGSKRSARVSVDDGDQELQFFKVEDGHLLFHLNLYVQTVNKLWQREGVWPDRYFYLHEDKFEARKLVRKLMVVAIERPDIFDGIESRYVLAARAFTLGYYLGIEDLNPLESGLEYWRKKLRTTRQGDEWLNPVPHIDYGTLMYERKDYAESLVQLQMALAMGEHQVCLLLAVVYFTTGDAERARQHLELYLQLAPVKQPYSAMATTFLENIDRPDAIALMYKAGKAGCAIA